MENVNGYFSEFATWFASGEPEQRHEVVHVRFLERSKLDYALDSLRVVDRYLDHLHRMQPPEFRSDWITTVLRAGAYVGEVLARLSPRTLDWVEFNVLVAHHPDAKKWLGGEAQTKTRAVLTTPDFAFMTAPLRKVVKYILDGEGDSVWYYVQVMLQDLARADRPS